MANFRSELDNYQVIPRELVFDTSLSDRARFVYVYMASKSDGWEFFMEPMASELGYGVETLRKYIKELVASGWLVKGCQNNNGTFGSVEYVLVASKSSNDERKRFEETPTRKKPDTEKTRHGENQTQYNRDIIEKQDNIEKQEEKEKILKEKAFIDEIYSMYPSRCPIRNTSLGKCSKNKKQIATLLKSYTPEQIKSVVMSELSEKLGKSYLKNFTTFLNQFPDPDTISAASDNGHIDVASVGVDSESSKTNEWQF